MRAIDLHCDTVMKLWYDKSRESLLSNSLSIDYEKLKMGKVLAQCFALFTPTHQDAVDNLTPWETVNQIHDRFTLEMEKCKGKLEAVKSVDDIIKNDEKGIISAILTIEDSGVIEGDLRRLETFSSWGVKIASLTWNWDNELASPQSEDKSVMRQGLKKLGFEALEYFDANGIIVDVSHLSDGGFWDVIGQQGKVIATHSNSRELTNVGRNLTDEMIKALSDKGGVMGLNFCPSFLSSDKQHESRIADMVTHINHIYKVGGEDVLALGSDFDGIGGKLDVATSADLPKLESALLSSGLKQSVIEKMWSKNILRLL